MATRSKMNQNVRDIYINMLSSRTIVEATEIIHNPADKRYSSLIYMEYANMSKSGSILKRRKMIYGTKSNEIVCITALMPIYFKDGSWTYGV